MATTKIKDHYFEYENMKYFRDNASALKLGTYGEKKDPAGAKSQVDRQGNIQVEYLTSEVVTGPIIASIVWSQTNRNDFEINGNVRYFGIKGGYYMHAGGHGTISTDWPVFITYIKKLL